MNFEENNKAIYLQIADRICDAILKGEYEENQRIPSVREYASALEVNANTVMRTYERLTSKDLIYNKRGIGFFVSSGAKIKIMLEKSEELIDKQLPPLFRMMSYLKITPDQLAEAYRKFLESSS